MQLARVRLGFLPVVLTILAMGQAKAATGAALRAGSPDSRSAYSLGLLPLAALAFELLLFGIVFTILARAVKPGNREEALHP